MTTSADCPARVPVAINGHGFVANPQITRTTVPVMRQQADVSTEAGEASLNPQGLWRRSQESWHHGAGQAFLDGRQGDEATDPHRFRSSKGVDVWTRGQVSLLHPTIKAWSTANTNLYLATTYGSAGGFALYLVDGDEVYWADMPFGGLNTYASQSGTGWTVTNGTITTSPVAFSAGWFRITATASAAVTATSPTGTAGISVDPGRAYSLVFGSKNISGSGARTPQVTVSWYTAAGALISSAGPTAAASTDVVLARIVTTATAPATAAFAALTVGWTTNLTNGDVHDGVANLAPSDDTGTAGPDVWYPANIQAGQAAQAVQSLASDGYNIWAALGTSGLHRTTHTAWYSSTADVPAAPASGQISLVGYANGFLLAAGSAGVASSRQNSLWLVNDPLGTPALSLIKTHANTSFVWTGIGPGRSCVYAWGNSGGNGEVYKVLFDPNTGSLSTAASPATYLPDGETIHALAFYAGGIIMGTGRGVRIGTADGAGNIDYGPLIPTVWPVRCLEPQDRYCWFGWTKYDTTNSGLGRIDLGFLTDTLTPAWASDLMTADASTGDTVAVVTFAPYGYTASQRPPVRVFTVAGKGVYIEDPGSRMASGEMRTGTVRFSTSEPKTLRSVDMRHHALPAGGIVQALVSRDGDFSSWEGLLPSTTTGSFGATMASSGAAAESFELWLALTRPTPAGTDYTLSPEMTRWTAKALPQPSTVDETFEIPLVMRARAETGQGDGTPWDIDVAAEIAYLKGLERTRTLIDVQIGAETISNCYVAASKFEPDVWGDERLQLEGIYTVQVSTARG